MSKDVQFGDLSIASNELAAIPPQNQLKTSCWDTVIGATDIFSKSLKLGRIRGVVSIFNTTSLMHTHPSDLAHIIQELINRDILVVIFNCDSSEAFGAGTSESDLFQDTGDGLAELCDYLNIRPIMHGDTTNEASNIVEFYTRLSEQSGVESRHLPTASIAAEQSQEYDLNLGALFTLQDDPTQTADLIDQHIHDKRISAQWCDRCGGRFSAFS